MMYEIWANGSDSTDSIVYSAAVIHVPMIAGRLPLVLSQAVSVVPMLALLFEKLTHPTMVANRLMSLVISVGWVIKDQDFEKAGADRSLACRLRVTLRLRGLSSLLH